MIEIRPVQNGFVADITGVEVANISAAAFERIYAAWLEYGVLRLRNQHFD